MNAFLEIAVALLAAIGVASLGWMLFGRLLSPGSRGAGGPVYAVVPAAGDADTLEYDVNGLLWLRGGELARFTIVIADQGLSDAGKAVAKALLARSDGLVVCPMERLPEYMRP